MTSIKRKLYRRGSSFETTIPMPLLFALDRDKKHNVIFNYEKETNRWYLEFETSDKRPKKDKEKK
ncbi:hypothetical protein JW968_01575 [Candidatus Woesearchaeota archaeon]|nr:hypothetical protein [Candidatus Woesearchaeota archaeon]